MMKLFTCHPELQTLFNQVIKTVDCTILQGFRGEDDQNQAFDEGRSKLPWPNSNHNHHPSLAVDVTPYPIDFENTNLALWFGGYVLGMAQSLKDQGTMTYGIRWGGDWDNDDKLNKPRELNDLVHFELV
jgi:peptidoglycan L-alanyl-D-glutamate endopeptidase CwlK